MNAIKITLSVDLVEDLFNTSPRTKEYQCCTTLILELKHEMENSMTQNLLEGLRTSITEVFDHALDELVFIDSSEDWT
jgi:hypothetical protein